MKLLTRWLTCISLVSFLWDIGKQYNPTCDAAFSHLGLFYLLRAVFMERWTKNLKSLGTKNSKSLGTKNSKSLGTKNSKSLGTKNSKSLGTKNSKSLGTKNSKSLGSEIQKWALWGICGYLFCLIHTNVNVLGQVHHICYLKWLSLLMI